MLIITSYFSPLFDYLGKLTVSSFLSCDLNATFDKAHHALDERSHSAVPYVGSSVAVLLILYTELP